MQASSVMSHKRIYPRKELYSEVVATDAHGQASSLLGINYSKSGIGIISFSPINIGEVLALEFTINDKTGSSIHRITAEVIQHYNVGEICVTGLQFKEELKLH